MSKSFAFYAKVSQLVAKQLQFVVKYSNIQEVFLRFFVKTSLLFGRRYCEGEADYFKFFLAALGLSHIHICTVFTLRVLYPEQSKLAFLTDN